MHADTQSLNFSIFKFPCKCGHTARANVVTLGVRANMGTVPVQTWSQSITFIICCLQTPTLARETATLGDMATAISMTTPAVATLSWKLTTNFTGREQESQLTIRLGKKNGRFTFFVPAGGSNSGKREQIGFGKKKPEGLAPAFGKFLHDKMQTAMSKWKKVAKMRAWMDNKHDWREEVRKQWKTKTGVASRMRKRSRSEMESLTPLASPAPSPLAYTPRSKVTTSIPVQLPEFVGLKTPAISVRVTGGKDTRHKRFVALWFPAALIPQKDRVKGKEISMGVQRGSSPGWKSFVVEYVQYAVSKWQTLKDAHAWYAVRGDFVELLNYVYVTHGYHATTRLWRLGKSTMKPDELYIRKRYFPKSALGNTGWGVFSIAAEAKINLPYSTPNKKLAILVHKDRYVISAAQKHYQAKGDPDDPDSKWVWVPTKLALRCGVVMPGMILNHRAENPTHEYYVESREDAEIRTMAGRPVTKGEELCWNYRYEDSVDDSPQKPRSRMDDLITATDHGRAVVSGEAIILGAESLIACHAAVAATTAAVTPADTAAVTKRRSTRARRRDTAAVTKRRGTRAPRDARRRDTDTSADTNRDAIQVAYALGLTSTGVISAGLPATTAAERAAERAAINTCFAAGLAYGRVCVSAETPVKDPTNNVFYVAHDIKRGWGGQCLFVAFEDQLSLIQDRANLKYNQLRVLAVRTQRQGMCNVPGMSRSKAELKKMLRASSYGDDHEISALSVALQVNVRICMFYPAKPPVWVRVNPRGDIATPTLPTVRLALDYEHVGSDNNHYMSMRPLPRAISLHQHALSGLRTFATIKAIVEGRQMKNIGVQVKEVLRVFESQKMDVHLVYRWVKPLELNITKKTKLPLYEMPSGDNDVLNVAAKGSQVLYTWSTVDLQGRFFGESTGRKNLLIFIAGTYSDGKRRNRHIAYGSPAKSGRVVFKSGFGLVPVAWVSFA